MNITDVDIGIKYKKKTKNDYLHGIIKQPGKQNVKIFIVPTYNNDMSNLSIYKPIL